MQSRNRQISRMWQRLHRYHDNEDTLEAIISDRDRLIREKNYIIRHMAEQPQYQHTTPVRTGRTNIIPPTVEVFPSSP